MGGGGHTTDDSPNVKESEHPTKKTADGKAAEDQGFRLHKTSDTRLPENQERGKRQKGCKEEKGELQFQKSAQPNRDIERRGKRGGNVFT